MQLKLHPMEIDTDDPFSNDLLHRKGEIENLSSLLANLNTPCVFAIDSEWGTGKTTFVELWSSYLKSQGVWSLTFNAWESDFSEEPLLAFLGEIDKSLAALTESTEEITEIWRKIKYVGNKVATRGLPALLKVATAGIIDADNLIEDELSGVVKDLAKDSIEDYQASKNAISEFRKSLSDLITKSGMDTPLVIFVDELDRCRPTYALLLLERIKHMFDIPGIVFVLALDKSQLSHSIKAVYGHGFDSVRYLQRFIDFEYRLASPSYKDFTLAMIAAFSLDELLEPRGNYRELQYDASHLRDTFVMLAKHLSLSLREIQQFLGRINLALRTAKYNEFIHPDLLVFLVIVRAKKQDIYRRFVSSDCDATEMIEYLREIVPSSDEDALFPKAMIEGFLIAAKAGRFSSSYEREHNRIVGDQELEPSVRKYSETVLEVVQKFTRGISRGVDLNTLINRIELTQRFLFDSEGS